MRQQVRALHQSLPPQAACLRALRARLHESQRLQAAKGRQEQQCHAQQLASMQATAALQAQQLQAAAHALVSASCGIGRLYFILRYSGVVCIGCGSPMSMQTAHPCQYRPFIHANVSCSSNLRSHTLLLSAGVTTAGAGGGPDVAREAAAGSAKGAQARSAASPRGPRRKPQGKACWLS